MGATRFATYVEPCCLTVGPSRRAISARPRISGLTTVAMSERGDTSTSVHTGGVQFVVLALVVGAMVAVALMVSTAVGQHRRGRGLPLVILAGLFFPITWIVWYVHDEHPYSGIHGV